MEEWVTRYPQLFDERDVEITRNQLQYHFFEWLAAVLLYEAMGYLSLVEKYETASHPRKLDIFRRAVSAELYDYVIANRSGVPDLFVYSPNLDNWFFCEIKGVGDSLRRHQIERHAALEELSGKPVMILKLNERKL
jgi:hypothetical protein